MGLPRNNRLKTYAQDLKINATEAEKKLWRGFLREYYPYFTCQKVIGSYIVDFFCNKARISIELDGSQHFNADSLIYDKTRTTYLEMLEIQELRYTNVDIFEDFDGVCETITTLFS